MPRLMLPLGLLLLLPLPARAQDTPRVEIFGGFSFSNVKLGEERVNARGWHAMIAVNSRYSWLEFEADVSGHYGSLDGARTATHVAMAGMRSSIRRGRLTGFVHSLYGVSFGHPPVIALNEFDPRPQRVWFTFTPGGGGLDIGLSKRIAVRLFQFDVIFHSNAPEYLQTFPQTGYSTMQFRLSSGVVLRFGKI